jgi:ethanolamine ammonia-lyase large subunit
MGEGRSEICPTSAMYTASMPWRHTIGGVVHRFDDLKTLLAKASPARSGDDLAGISARTAEERVAAQMALADLPLSTFQSELPIPYDLNPA